MKVTSGTILLFFVLTSAKEVARVMNVKRYDVIQNLLEGLDGETWSLEERACADTTKAILNGVKNNTLWATWVWDSMQLPAGTLYGSVYNFGSFDQCLQVPWSQPDLQTQYCLVDVQLTDLNDYDGNLVDPYDAADRYIGAKFRYGKRLHTIHLGVCLPASCKTESIAKITRLIFRQSHLPFTDVVVDPRDCQMADDVNKPMGYYVFWSIILAMAFICVVVYFVSNTKDKSDSVVSKICRCFCLSRNFDALTEVREDEIKVMNGIRVLTCGILIAGHYFYFIQFVAIFNKNDAEKSLTEFPFKLTLHSDLYVDTFMLMSGLLYFRGLMTSKSHKPVTTLMKRYVRLLVPLYALSIVFITYVLPQIGSGPAWPRLSRVHHEPCAKSWWRNILMISNKVDEESYCSETSWYIHCDFQLSILATILFIVYHKSKKTGIILCGLFYVISILINTVWNYWAELPGLLLYDVGPESQKMKSNKVYNTVYMPVYTRASTYLFGMAMGYLMSVYKPQDHRKSIPKTFSIVGCAIGLYLLIWVLQIGAKLFKKEYDPLSLAFVAAFDKSIWSLAICMIIGVCEYGTLPIVNDFLSSKLFVPLSKLSYSNYLLHTLLIYREIYSIRTPPQYDGITLILHGLGYVMISYATSYLLWLFVEAPVTNLISLIYDFNRKSQIQEISKVADGTNGRIEKNQKVL